VQFDDWEIDLAAGQVARRSELGGLIYPAGDGSPRLLGNTGSPREGRIVAIRNFDDAQEAGEGTILLENFRQHDCSWIDAGRRVLGTRTDETGVEIQVWDATSGKMQHSWKRVIASYDGWTVSSSGDHLAHKSSDPTGVTTITIPPPHPANGAPAAEQRVFPLAAPGMGNNTNITLSADGKFLAAEMAGGSVGVYDTQSGEKRGELIPTVPFALGARHLQISSSGNFLLTTREIWDISGTTPRRVWQPPEPDRALSSGLFCRLPLRSAGALFDDERHVLLIREGRLEIWDWRDAERRRPRATLFFLPDGEWAFCNHDTGCNNSSLYAMNFLRFQHVDADGREEWLTHRDFEKRTGWKNNPARAGVQFTLGGWRSKLTVAPGQDGIRRMVHGL
jgi:hypothetical protein